MIQSIIMGSSRAFLLLLYLSCACGLLQAQSENVLDRDDDETAMSTTQRQQALTALLEAGRQTREPLKAAGFLNRAGRLQLDLHPEADSLSIYLEALQLTRAQTDSNARVDSLNGVAAAYTKLSECRPARIHLLRAISLSERIGYLAGKAESLLILSACQNYDDHLGALRSAQESLHLYQSLNRKWWIAQAYATIGHYQLARGDLVEAEESHNAALNLWRELNNLPEQAEALINLGFVEYRRGAWQASLSFHDEAKSLLDEKAELYKMGQLTTGIGEVYVDSGLPEIGLPKLQQALEYYQRAQSKRAVIILTWDIGRTHYLLGNYPLALEKIQAALIEAETKKETGVVSLCHDFLGRTYLAMGDRAGAMQHFWTAFELYNHVGKHMEAARIQALIGQVYEQRGNFVGARKNYQTALLTFRSMSDQINESATLFAWGNLELRQNNLDAAEQYLRQSIDTTENMRRVSSSYDLATAFSAAMYDRYQSYIECLMRKHAQQPDRGFDAQALETSELARTRVLGEMLRSTETGFAPGVERELMVREKMLRQSLRAKEDYKVQLLGEDYNPLELASLNEELERSGEEYKQVAEVIRARYPAFERLTHPAPWNLKQSQEQVFSDDQTVMLEYILGPNKSYVWAVTRDGLASYELPSQEIITKLARKVYELLKTAPTAGTETELNLASQQLSAMILLPVASHLNKQKIVVVSDGALNYIPFQFLPAPSSPQEQLVANHEIINAPSAAVEGQLRQETARRQPAANVLAAFGDPVFRANFAEQPDREGQLVAAVSETSSRDVRNTASTRASFNPATVEPLFYSGPELATLREVAGDKTLIARRFDASMESLRNTDLTKYSILHLATHGVLDPKYPEESGLLLSTVDRQGREQKGFVGLEEIYSLHAPVDLVVLSACETGLGKDVRGEGLIGLTRGFIYAGASSVVASLWRVDDRATSELMKRFYTNMLKHGMKPSEALRAAQNSIRQEPQWRAPYYWAAFTLQGDYRQSILLPATTETRTRQKVIVGLVASLILLAGAAWYFVHRRTRHSIAN